VQRCENLRNSLGLKYESPALTAELQAQGALMRETSNIQRSTSNLHCMKSSAAIGSLDWEIIADNLSKAGFSLGWVSTLDFEGRMIWIVDAHQVGKRFVVRADEKLTAFVELERAIH
jgi:hypothetical protein